uniref:Ig-like domain-containing protein n=1 Tax=Naja naja TaxID=35670 RepID=A0A8C6VQX9_NAJNA
ETGATSTDSNVSIGCLIKGYFPEPATVQWNAGAITSGIQHFPPVVHSSGQYTHTSLLTIPISQWESEAFHCNVEHAATKTTINKNIEPRKCEGNHLFICFSLTNFHPRPAPKLHFSSGVATYLLPPQTKDLYININAKIVCVVVNLQQEEGLKISWSREKEVATHPELVAVTEENNGTFTAVGHLPVSAHDWESGETFTCSVEYPGLPGPIVKTISKRRGKEEAPIIHIYPPIPGNSLIISCFVRGFYPRDMDVQWLKNGNAISEDDYVNTPSVKEKTDDSSFMYSKLTIPKSSWDQGDIFSCMVIHEALEMKFTQKTIEKTSGKR